MRRQEDRRACRYSFRQTTRRNRDESDDKPTDRGRQTIKLKEQIDSRADKVATYIKLLLCMQ